MTGEKHHHHTTWTQTTLIMAMMPSTFQYNIPCHHLFSRLSHDLVFLCIISRFGVFFPAFQLHLICAIEGLALFGSFFSFSFVESRLWTFHCLLTRQKGVGASASQLLVVTSAVSAVSALGSSGSTANLQTEGCGCTIRISAGFHRTYP